MHAYLIIASNEIQFVNEVIKLEKLHKSKSISFPLQKIEEARNLNSFLSLKISEPTIISIKNLQYASEECVNAILKNLEEPQENVTYAIHATNESMILPTIRSRCKIIRITESALKDDYSDIINFVNAGISDKFKFIEDKKKREETLYFANRLVSYLGIAITNSKNESSSQKVAHLAKCAVIYKTALEANGNVILQNLHFLSDINN